MTINLDNYSYSYANEIGCLLKQPLYTLVANREASLLNPPTRTIDEIIVTIVKAVFWNLSCLILYVPAAILWFAGKKICLLSNSKISQEGLSLIPPPLEIAAPASNGLVNIFDLSTKFNKLFPEAATAEDGKTSKQECLRLMCDRITSKHESIYSENGTKRELFLNEMSRYLKGILLELQRKNLSPDKERNILAELAEASTRCYPTWLEASKKLYAEVTEKVETAEIKLLRHVQNYKEELILNFCQTTANFQWHILNAIRKKLGEELGLDVTHQDLDPYASYISIDKSIAKWIFKAQYKNTNRLVSAIQTKIMFLPYDPCYHAHLVNIAKELGASDPSDYTATHFFDENGQINELGVNLMLKSIGVLE